MSVLPYDPGQLPSRPPPEQGEIVKIELSGYPPWKDRHFSIRNRNHPLHDRFVALREAATLAMKHRAWVMGPVAMDFILFAPVCEFGRALVDYAGGIMDTVDGSSGQTFTYLPIIIQDDCQVSHLCSSLIRTDEVSYRVVFTAI